jgi:hypothetical protein
VWRLKLDLGEPGCHHQKLFFPYLDKRFLALRRVCNVTHLGQVCPGAIQGPVHPYWPETNPSWRICSSFPRKWCEASYFSPLPCPYIVPTMFSTGYDVGKQSVLEVLGNNTACCREARRRSPSRLIEEPVYSPHPVLTDKLTPREVGSTKDRDPRILAVGSGSWYQWTICLTTDAPSLTCRSLKSRSGFWCWWQTK